MQTNSIFLTKTSRLAQALSRKTKVPVKLINGISRTDGEVLYLDMHHGEYEGELKQFYDGVSDHETAHIMFTEFINTKAKNVMTDPIAINIFTDKKYNHACQHLEDLRVNKLMGNMYLGCKENITSSEETALMFHDQNFNKAKNIFNYSFKERCLLYLRSKLYKFYINKYFSNDYFVTNDFEKLWQSKFASKFNSCSTTTECVKIAKDLVDAIDKLEEKLKKEFEDKKKKEQEKKDEKNNKKDKKEKENKKQDKKQKEEVEEDEENNDESESEEEEREKDDENNNEEDESENEKLESSNDDEENDDESKSEKDSDSEDSNEEDNDDDQEKEEDFNNGDDLDEESSSKESSDSEDSNEEDNDDEESRKEKLEEFINDEQYKEDEGEMDEVENKELKKMFDENISDNDILDNIFDSQDEVQEKDIIVDLKNKNDLKNFYKEGLEKEFSKNNKRYIKYGRGLENFSEMINKMKSGDVVHFRKEYKEWLDNMDNKEANNILKTFQQFLFSRSLVFEYEHESEGDYNINELLRQSSLDNYNSHFPFINKTTSNDKSIAISLLIDMSGSMMGTKIITAQRIVILLAETFKRLNIQFEVCGFNSNRRSGCYIQCGRIESINYFVFKNFNDQDNSYLSQIKNFVNNSNADGAAMEVSANRLFSRQEDRKILFYICDGQPTGYASHEAGVNHMKFIAEQTKQSGMEFYSIGIETHTEEIFGKQISFCVKNDKSLSQNLARIITNKI